ncbi:hypothetical protein H2248_005662 [Termitomyces sp. 'cryptogamus']|nr:hypothetical protein H2248_005662 [Termitomyces sp. 'cryptogamus']
MPYIEKHRPLISQRIKFKPSPYPSRAVITPRILFSYEHLQRSARRNTKGPSDLDGEPREAQSDGVRSGTPELSPPRQRGQARTPRPDNRVDQASRRSRHVTIQEPSSDHEAGRRLTRSGTMRFRSAPPELVAEPSSALIKKPQGEPGRPNSNGHNVEVELLKLNWSKGQYNTLHNAVKMAANEQLDMGKSFRNQKQDVIKSICDSLTHDSRWPSLQQYADCWPVRSLLKMVLKAGADSHKRAHVNQLQAAVAGMSQGRGFSV